MKVALPHTAWHATRASEGAMKILFVVPAFIVFGIVIRSIPANRGATSITLNRNENARIASYLNVVRKTEVANERRAINPTELRAVANMWVEGYHSGALKPILPDSFGRPICDGAKAEIFGSVNILSSRLDQLVGNETAHHHAWRACQDALLSARALSSLRYSDYTSQSLVAMRDRKVIRLISENAPRSRAHRLELRAAANDLIPDPKAFHEMNLTQQELQVLEQQHVDEMQAAIKGMPGADAVTIPPLQDVRDRERSAVRLDLEEQKELLALQKKLAS